MSQPIAAVNGNGDERQTLVVVFLRGGADGLTLVPPVEDDNYYRARPRIATAKKDAVLLDSLFGLHPLLAPLKPVYAEGHLSILHAAGSEDDTHSHFDAQDLMEHGGGITAGGWLGRFLRYRSAGGPLSAIALGRKFPECLRGARHPSWIELSDSPDRLAKPPGRPVARTTPQGNLCPSPTRLKNAPKAP